MQSDAYRQNGNDGNSSHRNESGTFMQESKMVVVCYIANNLGYCVSYVFLAPIMYIQVKSRCKITAQTSTVYS